MAAGFKSLDDRPELIDRFAEERTDEIRAHPRFQEALRHSAHGALALNTAHPEMSAALKDIGRFWTGLLCLYLHCSEGGMTLSRLRETCAATGFMSPSAAEALLAYMRDIGFVVPAAEQPDRRQIRLEAPQLVDYFRIRLKIEMGAAAIIDPRLQPVVDGWDTSQAMEVFNVVHGADLMATARVLEMDTPNIQDLFSRNAGPLMTMRLMVGGEADDSFPPVRPVRLSMNALAQEFDVSRIHVSRFIETGEESGFFVRSADGRSVSFTPLLREKYEIYFCRMYLEWMGSREPALALLAEREAAG